MNTDKTFRLRGDMWTFRDGRTYDWDGLVELLFAENELYPCWFSCEIRKTGEAHGVLDYVEALMRDGLLEVVG